MMKWETIAEFSFICGVLLAFIVGTMHSGNENSYNLLMVLGSIVGLINIFDTELGRFTNALVVIIISAIAFIVLGWVSSNPMLIFFKDLSMAIALFTAPVAFIGAIKEVYNIMIEYKNKKNKTRHSKKRVSRKKRR